MARVKGRARSGSTATKVDKPKTAAPVSDEDDVRLAVQRLKRERIVAAAVTQFEQRGFSQASLDAVAEQMGVTKPFIYTQFRSKSELLGEICSRAIRISLQAIDEALTGQSTPRQQLEHFARGLMLGALRSGKHLAIYMREEKNLAPADYELIRTLRREVDEKLVGILQRGVAQGEFDIKEPRLAAIAIGGIATWVGVRLGKSDRYSPEQVAEQIVPLVVALAGARPLSARAKGR
jgi:AcrR family transcriptional regulator